MADDPGTGGTWEETFASWLREKQAGPMRCPVCGQGHFTPGGTVGIILVDDLSLPTAQFGYTFCGNCGYTMFFNAETTGLLFGDDG
jgi:hypothetical protein